MLRTKDLNFLHTYIKNEEQNKAELLDYVELGDLKSQERFSNAINSMETEKILQVLKTIHEQQPLLTECLCRQNTTYSY